MKRHIPSKGFNAIFANFPFKVIIRFRNFRFRIYEDGEKYVKLTKIRNFP